MGVGRIEAALRARVAAGASARAAVLSLDQRRALKLWREARVQIRYYGLPAAPAARPPKPNTAAMMAMMKNTTA